MCNKFGVYWDCHTHKAGFFFLNAVPLWTNQTLMGGSSGLFPEVCFYHFSRGHCRGSEMRIIQLLAIQQIPLNPGHWTFKRTFFFFFNGPVDNSPVCRLSLFAWVCVLMSFTPSRRVWQLCKRMAPTLKSPCDNEAMRWRSLFAPLPHRYHHHHHPKRWEEGGGVHTMKSWMTQGGGGGCRILNEEKKKWMRRRWREERGQT